MRPRLEIPFQTSLITLHERESWHKSGAIFLKNAFNCLQKYFTAVQDRTGVRWGALKTDGLLDGVERFQVEVSRFELSMPVQVIADLV